jgi:hypothetical protein
MMLYNFFFCLAMTTSIMTDPTDKRWLLIWTAVFPGFLVVTFQDACTFQARTTVGVLNMMLLLIALPVLLLFSISLALNIDGSLMSKAFGDGTLAGLNGVGQALQFPMPAVADAAGVPTSEGAWLPYVTMMLLTNMLFILKSAIVSRFLCLRSKFEIGMLVLMGQGVDKARTQKDLLCLSVTSSL